MRGRCRDPDIVTGFQRRRDVNGRIRYDSPL